ncbi:MAG TPA: DsrE family protein [Gemmatimonadaceae bacterium]|jgi:intracellular sulfur oxidation DsrE/DsrF family protein
MSRRIIPFALATVLLLPAAASSQATGADVIKQQGAGPIASGITFPMPADLHYRIAWRVNVGPTAPDSVVPGFREAASFLYVSDANKVPRANVHLAVVVWGTATHSLLKNEAYKAAKGTDNASIPLLQALNDAGVQVIVCGVALINRKLSPSDLLPFVKVAPTATHALATLHAQGYGILTP